MLTFEGYKSTACVSMGLVIQFKTPHSLKCSVFKLYKWIASSCCYSTVVLPVLGHVDISFVTPLLTPAENRSKGFVFMFRKDLFTSPSQVNCCLPHLWRKIKIAAAKLKCFPAIKCMLQERYPKLTEIKGAVILSLGGDPDVQSSITSA